MYKAIKLFILFSFVFTTTAFASVPIGTILPFYGNNSQLPKGYLFCDGTQASKATYPDLYDHLLQADPNLKFGPTWVSLPDLRGEFLRGWDNGRNVDRNRTLGSHQDGEIKQHSHTLQPRFKNNSSGVHNGSNKNYVTIISPSGQQTGSVGGNETRPRNIAINFIIKAK